MPTPKIPGPDHPISITPSTSHVVVRAGGVVIADTRHALELREASYPVVYYVPRSDVTMEQLVATDHATYCPYKGDCSYFSIPNAGDKATNAVWAYATPYAAVSAIADHVAFYPNHVDAIEVS